jgi:hypothetical protein
LLPAGAGHRLSPVGIGSPLLGGVTVASPSAAAAMMPNQVGRSVGTSVAAATLTGLAARLHEVLEACYADFTQLSSRRRAVLLKALLVHGARWSAARDLIIEVLGPADGRQHVRQKDNVRRYLGYGAVDADAVLACAEDRATLWSVGELGSEQGHAFSVPLPAAMSARAQAHEISITVAWFAPPRVGAAAYRGARLRLVNPETGVELFAVAPDKAQHRTRSILIRQRIQISNAIRSHMTEFGMAAAVGRQGLHSLIEVVHDAADERVPVEARGCLVMLAAQLQLVNEQVLETDRLIRTNARSTEMGRRLMEIPGVGPLLASALVGTIADPSAFKTGRNLAAWIGLVPKQNSSGGKERLGGITKQGDR